ncbi:IS5 family transposase [Methyloglobulus sp.]|uniref:IS5 family transposase n=1 Tax=Methyloglobulus sp. TaxID=2518622 RepID=UPI0032B7BA96
MLQSWYGLSDPGLEKQLARDLMFRRFINLGLSESVPDHSTVWRFRNTLTKQGLLDTLLSEVNRKLSAKGLYIKTGEAVIVDATVIEAKQSRPRKGKGGGNTQDSEVGYSVKAAADGYTPGNEHDSHSLKKLLTTTEEQVYADKAYASAEHDRLLAKRNTGNRVLHKARRNQPLNEQQKHLNRQWSSVRCTVERVFGILKQHCRLAKARYSGLQRNPSPVHAGGDGLQHQARRGGPGRDAGVCRITPPNARKTAKNSQGFMKNCAINAYSSRILPIKVNAHSKKSAFD